MTVPKLLVCQHVPYEILGTLDPLLRSSGFRIRYVNFGRDPHARPNLDGYDGLIVLGGPMSAWETERCPHLTTELALIEQAMQRRVPVLGICLGAQLIASALGARVRSSPQPEIGWYEVSRSAAGKEDPVLAHFAEREKVFQWHCDAFEVPDSAVHLAESSVCAQAFRYGDNVYGFQFHLEVDEALIDRWLVVPQHVSELDRWKGTIDPERIRSEVPCHIERLKRLSDHTFGRFLRLFWPSPRRFAVLPSR